MNKIKINFKKIVHLGGKLMKDNFEATSTRSSELKDAINEVLGAFEKAQAKAKAIISNNKYMLWLEKFTASHPSFTDDTWLYSPEDISKEDYDNVADICSFFDGIMHYANKNYLHIYYDCDGSNVFIKFNNIGYNLGIIHGQGTYIYCNRVEISSDHFFIDFNDIMNNKKQSQVDFINAKFEAMSDIIEELLKIGISEKVICKKIQHTINKFEEENSKED